MNDQNLFYKELKAKRESQNLTLEEISDFTKIDIKFLIAIEKGDFSCLPSVYMRLFLRSYCKYISADIEQTLNDYEFHTLGTKTETKSFVFPNNSDKDDSSVNEKELNLPQVPTTKIITIVITVAALALTFFLISKIDSNSTDQNNQEEENNGSNDIENELEQFLFSELPNEKMLTDDDFKLENLVDGFEKILVLSAPFTFRIEALTKTKISVTNEIGNKAMFTNKILKAGDVEVFTVEKKISYDLWSAQHIKCSLNDINLTEHFGSDDKTIRGWFTTDKSKLIYNLYKHSSI